MADITIGRALLISLIGMCVVFVVLLIIMCMIWVMSTLLKRKRQEVSADAAPVSAAVTEPRLAPGSCGEVKTFGVPDATAAMLMAIVADKLGKPLNELRFVSIREVEDTEK